MRVSNSSPRGGNTSPRRTARCDLSAFRCVLHTASPFQPVSGLGTEPCLDLVCGIAAFHAAPRSPALLAPSIPRRAYFDERFRQRRRIGLRSSALLSGVNRTHHGPCGAACTPSNRPALHQATTVEIFTFSNPAAACTL